MLRSNIQMNEFVVQLKILLRSMIVKRDKLAEAFETSLEFRKAADKYVNTIDNGDMWESYIKFDRDVLIAAGLDPTAISQYMTDKENIPREMRAKVVALEKQYIIDNYVEMNDYYLMLHGEPPIEDTAEDYIYVPDNDYGIPTNIPVHKLSIDYVNTLESTGILDTLKTKYPNKTYLNYLGRRAIDYYTARTTNNFGILYIETKEVDTVIRENFITAYDKARAYYMIGYYNREYSAMFLWYDEFMGLLILMMAIQRLVANIFKQGLTRDFYDVNLIKYLFKSYSIPYIEELDIKYQRELAKNLNYLLQYKATDRVLYDVSYLLGFYDVNIYKYYLVKTHNMNEDGLPIFAYKTIRENGETKQVYDYPKMYSFHFQQVNLKEEDLTSALVDDRNKVRYSEIVSDDPYWVEDQDLMDKLYETDFNHVVSKYMSLDVTVKKVEMMYEVAHTIRAVIDNQKDFRKIQIDIPSISDVTMTLFDAIILLCALGSYKLNLNGSIPLKGYQIANVYGFNYTQDIDALKAAIYDTKDLEAGEILFAQDTQTFYEVHGGEIVKIPNHFRNQFVSDNTSPTTEVRKDRFSPLDTILVREIDEMVKPSYYKYIPPTTPVYRYTGTRYEIVTPASLPDLDSVVFVKDIPEKGDPEKCYIQYYEDLFGYYNGVHFEQKEVTFVSTIGYNLIDSGLAQYILHMRAVTEKDLGTIYANIKSLRMFVTKMLDETTDKDVYFQYRKLYNSLLVTEDSQDLYCDAKGVPYQTYAELLKAINGSLYAEYERIIAIDTGVDNALNSIFSRLASYSDYIFLANVNRITNMFDIVMRLIRFFKSYTVDFVNSGIRYLFEDRYLQAMKLLDSLEISDSHLDIKESAFVNGRYYKDILEKITHLTVHEQNLLKDMVNRRTDMGIYDREHTMLIDKLLCDWESIEIRDGYQMYDDIGSMHKDLNAKSSLKFRDSLQIEVSYADDDD